MWQRGLCALMEKAASTPCSTPPAFGILPVWSRRQVRAEGPFGGCFPAQTPNNLPDYPGMASAVCARSRAPLLSRAERRLHSNAEKPRHGCGTGTWRGGGPPGTSGLPLMSPPESLGERGCRHRGLLRQPLVAPRGGLPPSAPFPRRTDTRWRGVFTAKSTKPTSKRPQVASPAPSRSVPITLAAQGRDPPKPRAPPAINISPRSASPVGRIGAVLAQDRIDGAGSAPHRAHGCAQGRRGDELGSQLSLRVFLPQICFLPCPHLQVCPCPCAQPGGCSGLSSSGCCGTHGGCGAG